MGNLAVRRPILGFFLASGLAFAGCASDDDTGDGDGMGDDCADNSCIELEPPDEAEGFQVILPGTMIQPGEDIEYCEVVALPGDESDIYYVNRFESEMTLGSHHLIVSAVEPGSETEAVVSVGDRTTCFTAGGAGWGDDYVEVTGQQLPYHEEQFPDGVGRIFHGGQELVFNYHFLNASDDPIPAKAAVNFYTTDSANVERIAESAGFIYIGIDVDPGATASYTVDCALGGEVWVHKLTRHTHKWGTDFPVYFSGGPSDGELIYTSPNYEDPDYVFDEPILMQPGEGFRFTCNYDNTSDHPLRFGEKTTDEMCILFATVWSPDQLEVPGQLGCLEVN